VAADRDIFFCLRRVKLANLVTARIELL
jgi:hypothetical protein